MFKRVWRFITRRLVPWIKDNRDDIGEVIDEIDDLYKRKNPPADHADRGADKP